MFNMYNTVKEYYLVDHIFTADNVKTCVGTWITQEQADELLSKQPTPQQ
ncbi:XkdX family protein [Apilactobacillus micheneri]|nr:XkdX family protein [Apilactobacillus micheneri]TPR43139.1 XkdX family protein [Apilactobacillus micheneri]TPR47227.1 XkdX family protein [Apilactobacillus micheneri]